MSTTDGDDPFEGYFRDTSPRPSRSDARHPNTPQPPNLQPPNAQPPSPYSSGGGPGGGWEPPTTTSTRAASPQGGPPRRGLPAELDPRGGGRARRAVPVQSGVSPLRRTLNVVGSLVSVVILVIAGVAWYIDSQFHPHTLNGLAANQTGQSSDDGAQNFLIMGTDSRAGLTQAQIDALHTGDESAACNCTDSMLLVHISPTRSGATIVSIPRDTWVSSFPSYVDANGVNHPAGGQGKINSAYTIGGPLLSVKTVETLTGLRIDHFIVVNFDAVVSLVNDVGGVVICTPVAMHDTNSGLNIPAGTQRLNGAQSLEWVRSRDIDGTGDLGREKRQQAFLVQLLHQTESTGITSIPGIVNQVSGSLTVDSGLSHDDMVGLATRLQGMSSNSISGITVPISNESYVPPNDPGVGETVVWDQTGAQALFGEVAQDINPATGQSLTTSGTPAPATSAPPTSASAAPSASSAAAPPVIVPDNPNNVNVQVFNDSGISGQASKVTTALSSLGFNIAGGASTGNATGQTATVVEYDPNYNQAAATVQAAIPGSTLQAVPGLGSVIHVQVGTSYHGTVSALEAVNTAQPSANSTTVPGSNTGPINQINVTNGSSVICPSK